MESNGSFLYVDEICGGFMRLVGNSKYGLVEIRLYSGLIYKLELLLRKDRLKIQEYASTQQRQVETCSLCESI
jgi:hypothetical protein